MGYGIREGRYGNRMDRVETMAGPYEIPQYGMG